MGIKRVLFLFMFCMITWVSSAQLSFVQTTKNDVLAKKYKKFVIVDQSTNYVLAKKPVKYDSGAPMPTSYFTIDIPAGLTKLAWGSRRMFVIHSLQEADQDWALENNKSEHDMFFGRARFVVNAIDKQWNMFVEGDAVIIQSKADRQYLSIDDTGDYKGVKDRASASRWKLYRAF